MTIEVLYFPGCPNHEPTVQQIRRTVERLGVEAMIRQIDVSAAGGAAIPGFLGSPTVRIDGQDIDPSAGNLPPVGLSCRRYPGGLPPAAWIEAAIVSAHLAGRRSECVSAG